MATKHSKSPRSKSPRRAAKPAEACSDLLTQLEGVKVAFGVGLDLLGDVFHGGSANPAREAKMAFLLDNLDACQARLDAVFDELWQAKKGGAS